MPRLNEESVLKNYEMFIHGDVCDMNNSYSKNQQDTLFTFNLFQ